MRAEIFTEVGMDNLILTALSCLSCFFSGFAVGMMFPPRVKPQPRQEKSRELGELMKRQLSEYKNFLSYDGSEQSP